MRVTTGHGSAETASFTPCERKVGREVLEAAPASDYRVTFS